MRYRLDIAPLTPLPLTRSPWFSYASDTLLVPGTLVEISFGARILRGIVGDGAPLPGRTPLWMKPIRRVIRTPWLTPAQLSLATAMAETYFSSLGNTLKHFVFPLPQKAISPQGGLKKPRAIRKVGTRQPRATGIEAKDEVTLQTLIIKKVQAYLEAKNQKQLLILFPDLLSLSLTARLLKQASSDSITTLSSRLTQKQHETTWEEIRTGEAKVILGTRQSIFAPFVTLKEIIVLFPEERLSYKQWDMTPYYVATEVIEELAELSGARLTWVSTALGLSERVRFPKVPADHWKPITLIDRRLDGKGARARAFSKPLTELIKQQIGKSARVMLLAKERGVSGVMLCQNCRATARCPQCEHVLGEHAAGHFRCFNCQYQSSLFPKCRSCGQMSFKSFGIGTVRVERELERLFPAANILRIDRDTLATKPLFETCLKRLEANTYDILITTPEIGTLLPIAPLDTAILLDGDSRLAFPSFDAEERLLIMLKRLRAKLKPSGGLVVETFAPEERLWQAATSTTLTPLWETLMEERTLLGYPPVTAMIKVSLSEESSFKGEDLALFESRFRAAIPPGSGIKLTPLFQGKRERGKRSMRLILRYPREIPLPAALIQFLKRESKHLTIDRSPLSTD